MQKDLEQQLVLAGDNEKSIKRKVNPIKAMIAETEAENGSLISEAKRRMNNDFEEDDEVDFSMPPEVIASEHEKVDDIFWFITKGFLEFEQRIRIVEKWWWRHRHS